MPWCIRCTRHDWAQGEVIARREVGDSVNNCVAGKRFVEWERKWIGVVEKERGPRWIKMYELVCERDA
jgi:hypothetical protein